MKTRTLLIVIGALCLVVLILGGSLLYNLGRQSAEPTDAPATEASSSPATVRPASPEDPAAVSLASLSSEPAQLAQQWGDAYEACRGGSGDDPATAAACSLEERIGQKLEAVGWCFKPGAAEWKPC